MIDINLIPAALRKDGNGDGNALKINIPKEILVGVGSGLVFLIVVIHLLLGAVWLLGIGRLSAYQANWQKVLPDKTILDGINKDSGDLRKKIKLIADLTAPIEVRWAPKFNAISDSLPRGLWIRRMTLDKGGLTIEGSVVSKSRNEINNVGKFLTELKQSDAFMNGFSSMEVNSIQRGRNNIIDVTDFTVMAKLNETKSK